MDSGNELLEEETNEIIKRKYLKVIILNNRENCQEIFTVKFLDDYYVY